MNDDRMSGLPQIELDAYREGFTDGLRWVLERFNLDTEDGEALCAAIEGGPWE